jgi:hypothetical protein
MQLMQIKTKLSTALKNKLHQISPMVIFKQSPRTQVHLSMLK